MSLKQKLNNNNNMINNNNIDDTSAVNIPPSSPRGNDYNIQHAYIYDNNNDTFNNNNNNNIKGGYSRNVSARSILLLKLITIAVLFLIFSFSVLRTRLSNLIDVSYSDINNNNNDSDNHYYYYATSSNSSRYHDNNKIINNKNKKKWRLRRRALTSRANSISDISLGEHIMQYDVAANSLNKLETKIKHLAKDVNINFINNNIIIYNNSNINNIKDNLSHTVNCMISSFDIILDYTKNQRIKRNNNNNNKIQLDPLDQITDLNIINIKRREAIVHAFLHSWYGYTNYSFGYDELYPNTKTGHNWSNREGNGNSLALTMIDAVTTMHIMGLHKEVNIVLNYIRDKLRFSSVDADVSVFETTIRVLGGLLSIYELTNEKHKFLLKKAKKIGDILLTSFNTSTGIPHCTINLKNKGHYSPSWLGNDASIAEIGTLQLEFRTLSYHTKDPIYDMKVTHITSILDSRAPDDYMCPVYINMNTARWDSDLVTMGALADSFFEYIIKQYVLTNGIEKRYANMTRKMLEGISKLIFRIKYTPPIHSLNKNKSMKSVKRDKNYLTYVSEYSYSSFSHKMEHLACFIGGNIALSSQELPDLTPEERNNMIEIAGEITETCVQFYKQQQIGISPESVIFHPENNNNNNNKPFDADRSYYILRPETMESLFYMWRYTKDQKWRDYGWDIFQAIDKYCKVTSGGYSGLRDVTVIPPEQDNLMQSFWLAETMKYMYLLFADDDNIDLNEWVFNTEAHPLRRRTRDPMDIWRSYEKEHGNVQWFPPPIIGVKPIETELMRRMRGNGSAKKTMDAYYNNIVNKNNNVTEEDLYMSYNDERIVDFKGVSRGNDTDIIHLLKPMGGNNNH